MAYRSCCTIWLFTLGLLVPQGMAIDDPTTAATTASTTTSTTPSATTSAATVSLRFSNKNSDILNSNPAYPTNQVDSGANTYPYPQPNYQQMDYAKAYAPPSYPQAYQQAPPQAYPLTNPQAYPQANPQAYPQTNPQPLYSPQAPQAAPAQNPYAQTNPQPVSQPMNQAGYPQKTNPQLASSVTQNQQFLFQILKALIQHYQSQQYPQPQFRPPQTSMFDMFMPRGNTGGGFRNLLNFRYMNDLFDFV